MPQRPPYAHGLWSCLVDHHSFFHVIENCGMACGVSICQYWFPRHKRANDMEVLSSIHGRINDLSLDSFNKSMNRPSMCVFSTLCGTVDKLSPFDICICIYSCVYTTNKSISICHVTIIDLRAYK